MQERLVEQLRRLQNAYRLDEHRCQLPVAQCSYCSLHQPVTELLREIEGEQVASDRDKWYYDNPDERMQPTSAAKVYYCQRCRVWDEVEAFRLPEDEWITPEQQVKRCAGCEVPSSIAASYMCDHCKEVLTR